MRRLGPRGRPYLDEVRSWSFGATFEDSLATNRATTGGLFESDSQFESELASPHAATALAALGELWLAAHFARRGFLLSRDRNLAARTPDFRFVGREVPARGAVEVKKVARWANVTATRPHPKSSGLAPALLTQIPDLPDDVKQRMRAAKGQLVATIDEYQILAIDYTGSRHHESTMRHQAFEDREATGAAIRQKAEADARALGVDVLLLFVLSLDQPELRSWRFIPIGVGPVTQSLKQFLGAAGCEDAPASLGL